MNSVARQRGRKQLGRPRKPEPRLIGFDDAIALRRISAAAARLRSTTAPACWPAPWQPRPHLRQRPVPRAPASSTEFTPSTIDSGSPCASLPPRASISSPSFMRFSSIQTPARPPAGSSSGGESTATGQDSAESRLRWRWCTVAWRRRCRPARRRCAGRSICGPKWST